MNIENMRNIIKGFGIILFTLLTLTACETDSATLLTDGVWTFQSMTTDSEESSIISLVSLAQALLTEASMEFQEGGTYIMISPFVENATTGEWELIGEDQLIIDPDDEASSTSRIKTLSKEKLSYTEDFVDGQMNTYMVTTTWTR
ncbi:MAG: hypothetical protein DRJ29_14260 [Bacteroidetes bacterium]|nr:MAG: hypothetical protein DRJ29_14260 [Bacteroidota bacterium]